jgi:antirestriction protein ArdC
VPRAKSRESLNPAHSANRTVRESLAKEFSWASSYIAGWLNKLRDDRKLLIHAAAQAQHAADFILRRDTTA